MKWLMFVALGLFSAFAFADVKVECPEKAPEHSLIFIVVEQGDFDTVDLEIWRGDSEVPYEQVTGSTEGQRRFVFTGPPGAYTVRAFGWKPGSKPEKYKSELVIGGTVPPGPQPGPGPGPGPAPDLEGLAKISYDAAMAVFSIGREAEAKQFANAYRSVSSRAAALPGMTARDMTNEIRKQLSSIDNRTKETWEFWAAAITAELGKIPDDRDAYIRAYREIATGLEAVK